MVGLPAAYVGCSTQHGTPLTGVGTPNVTVNGRPGGGALYPARVEFVMVRPDR
jgi:hypothetical protein